MSATRPPPRSDAVRRGSAPASCEPTSTRLRAWNSIAPLRWRGPTRSIWWVAPGSGSAGLGRAPPWRRSRPGGAVAEEPRPRSPVRLSSGAGSARRPCGAAPRPPPAPRTGHGGSRPGGLGRRGSPDARRRAPGWAIRAAHGTGSAPNPGSDLARSPGPTTYGPTGSFDPVPPPPLRRSHRPDVAGPPPCATLLRTPRLLARIG